MLQLLKSLDEVDALAREVARTLRPKQAATILALVGDLGAGKTTFTQALARALGVGEVVTSPTFVIEKIYKLDSKQRFGHLIHIDCYRLNSADELAHLGWQEISADPKNLIVIEWPERVGELVPTNSAELKFKFIDETTRAVEVSI